MKKVIYNFTIVLLFASLTTNVFGWSRTDARPFWSTQYRFKVWAGIVYKPYPNGSWTTVEYGEDAKRRYEARVTQNYSITYPPQYPYNSRQHNIYQDASRSFQKSTYTWTANVDRSRAYKRPGIDTLQEVNISFNDSLRNDTLFIDSLTGYFRAKFTGNNVARYKIIVWEAGFEGDETIETYKVLWEAGIEYSENGGYVLLNSMPTSGYSTGSTSAYNFVEFTNLSTYFVIPGGVNQNNIVITAIAEFDDEEEVIPTTIENDKSTNDFVEIVNANDWIKIANKTNEVYMANFYALNGKTQNSFVLKEKDELTINAQMLDSKLIIIGILDRNGAIVRREKILLNK